MRPDPAFFRSIANANGEVTTTELAAALWPERTHRSRTRSLRRLLRKHQFATSDQREGAQYRWRVDRRVDLWTLKAIWRLARPQDAAGEPPTPPDSDLDPARSVVGAGGRIGIPLAYRKALGIAEGDAVIMRLDGEELRIVSFDVETRRIRELLSRYVPKGVSVVDELLQERRREVAAEESS